MDNEEVNQMKMQEISGSKDVDLPANSSTEEIDNDSRFMMELEFVQMLSNPRYLNCMISRLIIWQTNNHLTRRFSSAKISRGRGFPYIFEIFELLERARIYKIYRVI